MTEALRKRVWARRLTLAAAVLSFGGIAAALLGAVGSGQGVWHFRTGFVILRYAFFATIAGGLIALAALLLVRRYGLHGLTRLNLVALIVSVVFVTYLGHQVRVSRQVPAIHDVSTNLDDVPSFYRLHVRQDNYADIPDLGRPPLARLTPRERWKAVHRMAYGDIRTISLPLSVSDTIDRAAALANERGWEVVTIDKVNGILEAVATSRFFRFKDNIVIRVRKGPEGEAVVDMRSLSRVGISDIGVNAKRIRAFLADMQEAKQG
ncbi:DUF1499 domain-containing protein [Allosphingosinicella humi]